MAQGNARKNDRSEAPGDGPAGRARRRSAPRASDILPYGATLPVQRAFVVHFAAAGGRRRRRFIGRVEHLSTAEVAPFSSLKSLLDFFDRLAFART